MKEKIKLLEGLPFISLTILHNNESILIENVLIDTGSASTIVKGDILEEIGVRPEDDDLLGSISGVGGCESVYLKRIDGIQIGELVINDFTIDVGIMDYGFDINGIIGMDLLSKIYSNIDLETFFITGHS